MVVPMRAKLGRKGAGAPGCSCLKRRARVDSFRMIVWER